FQTLSNLTDENGNKTTYTYESGRIKTILNANNELTTYNYFPATTPPDPRTGLLQSILTPMPRATAFDYDNNRRLTLTQETIQGPHGPVIVSSTTQSYDPQTGEVASIIDGLSRTTSMGYDAMGRMRSRTTPDTYQESWAYNPAGLLDSHTDKMGAVD